MSASAFLDTNVLVYAVDEDEPHKRELARSLLARAPEQRFVLSAQVLGEFYVTVTRKLARPVEEGLAATMVERLGALPTVGLDATLVRSAVALSRSARLAYWDALIVVSASVAGCERLLSEDLNDGQTIGSVRVVNPFAETLGPGR